MTTYISVPANFEQSPRQLSPCSGMENTLVGRCASTAMVQDNYQQLDLPADLFERVSERIQLPDCRAQQLHKAPGPEIQRPPKGLSHRQRECTELPEISETLVRRSRPCDSAPRQIEMDSAPIWHPRWDGRSRRVPAGFAPCVDGRSSPATSAAGAPLPTPCFRRPCSQRGRRRPPGAT